jgi:hypothetical protein
VELRQTLRQPVLAERAGCPVPSLRGLERLLPVRPLETGQAVPGRVCAAKQEKYYGFKVLMNSAGEIFRWWPANTDEREMLDASAIPVRRQGADLRRLQLAGRGVDLTTPLRANMKDDPWLIRQAMRLRRGIETAFGRLVEDFGVLRNKGRDFWRWSARFLRKVLAYNLSYAFRIEAFAFVICRKIAYEID